MLLHVTISLLCCGERGTMLCGVLSCGMVKVGPTSRVDIIPIVPNVIEA